MPSDVETLPSDVDSDSDDCMACEPCLPSASVAGKLNDDDHHYMEFFTPPRIALACIALGLMAVWSLDLTGGYDLALQSMQMYALGLLHKHRPRVLGLTPPCTMFNKIMRMWNEKKMDPKVFKERLDQAVMFVDFCMDSAMVQIASGRFFFFEQPELAVTWNLPSVKKTESLHGVRVVSFDMCRFGLKTPLTQQPMRKRTKIMTNSPLIAHALDRRFCLGGHKHRLVHGSEGGRPLAYWSQIFSPMFCDTIANCINQM